MYTLTLMSNFKGVIMKISEIAKETGLTVRAVRYYEELNLINLIKLIIINVFNHGDII